ncbi:MAG: antitoxin [Sulfuricellaceae bacterium]|jgi:antitoxin ChpS
MATVTLRSLGGSVVMTLPKQILGLMHLDAGNQVAVSVENGRLVVEPQRKPRYTLAALLAQCNDENMALSADERAWLDAPPVGKEVL